jgi:hypothetical protein
MKFYKDKIRTYNYFDNTKFFNKIKHDKLSAIYYFDDVRFFKNGQLHNSKNASYFGYNKLNGFKQFILNGKHYGTNYTFTKSSWRKFAKLQAFL